MRSYLRLSYLSVLLLAFALGVAACDLGDVDLILEVTDEPVTLGSDDGRVSVVAGETTTSTSTVDSGLDVDEVRELSEVEIEPSYFDFTESAAAGKVQDTGTLVVLVSIGLPPSGPLFPLPPITLTIVDNVVTQVQPSKISLLGSTLNVTQIQGILNSLPENQRPNMTELGNLTIDQARQGIEDALENATGFLFTLIVQSNGVSGTLKLNQFTVDARVVEQSK